MTQQRQYSISRDAYQTLGDSQNISIICLDVVLDGKDLFPTYDITVFRDEFKFIAHTLSIEDKTLLLIISTTTADYVIPLIHQHFCIEKIYLFDSPNNRSSVDWTLLSEKISYSSSNLEQLRDQVIDDITTMKKTLLQWKRSTELFTMLHMQILEIAQNSAIKISTNDRYNEEIILFHCNNQKLIKGKHGSIPFSEFSNVTECVQFITGKSQNALFLVISGDITPDALQSVFDLNQIHGIYFFRTIKPKYPLNGRKMSGLFDTVDDLYKQLHKDIFFFREQHFHTARIDVFSKTEHGKKLIPQLDKQQQSNFLIFNLFFDILLQIPPLQITPEDIENECKTLFLQTADSQETRFDVKMLDIEHAQSNPFELYPAFSQIILRLHQLNKLNDLLILQKQLVHIQQRVSHSPRVSTFFSVYLAKILSNKDLTIIQSSCDQIISIGIFLLATKSLLTARNIARQAANNGLVTVLFEIEVTNDIRLLNVDNDRVIFRLGTVFRLESINKGPDGVQYVKLKCADLDFQLVKEQLQTETGVELSWLTFGSYLYFLNRLEQAEAYYMYLQNKLRSEHMYLASVYNNIGTMYALDDKEDKANYLYDLAVKEVVLTGSVPTSDLHQSYISTEISKAQITIPKSVITLSTALGSIGEVHFKTNNYTKALEFYKKAFESTTDPRCRLHYQRMILSVSKELETNV